MSFNAIVDYVRKRTSAVLSNIRMMQVGIDLNKSGLERILDVCEDISRGLKRPGHKYSGHDDSFIFDGFVHIPILGRPSNEKKYNSPFPRSPHYGDDEYYKKRKGVLNYLRKEHVIGKYEIVGETLVFNQSLKFKVNNTMFYSYYKRMVELYDRKMQDSIPHMGHNI